LAHGTVLCTIETEKRQLLVVADGQLARLCDPSDGQLIREITSPSMLASFTAMASVPHDGVDLLATGDDQGTVQIWETESGRPYWASKCNDDMITSLVTMIVDGRPILASAGMDGTIVLLDPARRKKKAVLTGHQRAVTDVCAVVWRGRTAIASASADRTARLWTR
jgi:WD40 repeat protein